MERGGKHVISQRPAAAGTWTKARTCRIQLALLGIFALLLIFGAATSSAATYVPGTPASFCSASGAAAGQCEELKSIAVNPSNGHVFVVDSGNARVDEFDSAGNFVRAFGSGVATGVAGAEVCTTTCLKGLSTGTGAFGNPSRGIAIDPVNNVVYVATAVARVA